MTHPVQRFRYGSVSVAVWLNQSRSGVHYNVTAKRSYKDKETDEWHDSDSFSDSDLPALAKAAFDAHSWIQEQKRQASTTIVDEGDAEEDGPE